jgi:hypothetical protein
MNFKKIGGAMLLLAIQSAAQAEALPKWLLEAQARELQLPALTEVASTDGWLTARVPGLVKTKVEKADGGYSLDIALGSELMVSCEVIPGQKDLAAFLRSTAEASFEIVAKANGTVEARAVEAIDAGAVGAHPYLALRWLYRALRNGEKRVGGLQQFIAQLDEAALYCVNDDLGYVKTFDAVAKAVSTHLRTGRADGKAEPADLKIYFREISTVSVGGQRVGLAVLTLRRDAEGDTQLLNEMALLMQPSVGQLVASDQVDTEWTRPDGSLINALQVSVDNGKVDGDMRLARKDGRWLASGTLKGKKVEAELTSAPASYLAQALARRELMSRAQSVGSQTEALVWSTLDPTRLLPTRATLLAPVGTDQFSAREEIGPMALEAVLDRSTGTMVSAKMPIGALTMHLERVFKQGTF